MRMNFRPERVAFLDFETQSRAELVTSHKYASDPSTRVLSCVVKVDGRVRRMGPYLSTEDKEYLSQVSKDRTIVAHNAAFDGAVWEMCEGLPEAEWFDTLPCARAGGLPGGLDKLGKALGLGGKDDRGKKLIDMLCVVRGNVPAVGPAHQLLLDYNVRDVELLEQVYERVKDYGEPEVMAVDRAVNSRGVPLNAEYMERILALYAKNTEDNSSKFGELTGGVNPASPKQVVEWLRSLGFQVDSINRNEFRRLMDNPEEVLETDSDEDAAISLMQEALEARREVVRVGRSKAKTAIEAMDVDGRIREQTVYHGTNTGRWSGRHLQLHNMPAVVKGVKMGRVELDYASVVEEARMASERNGSKVAVADVVGMMLRHAVQSDCILAADYSAVEARGLAWLAGEESMLAAFRDPKRSVYVDFGESMFGRRISKDKEVKEYNFCKALVLGCGYGMSGVKFEKLCRIRGTDMSMLKGRNVADAVKVYRKTYSKIPELWRKYEVAVLDAVRGTPTEAGKCKFYMAKDGLRIVLPSGRTMVYRDATVETVVPAYCRMFNLPEVPVDTVVYTKPNGMRTYLWGSKMCENVDQAVCRDLLAETVVRSEQLGLRPFLHVHDEVNNEAPDSRMEEFLSIMSEPPAWASGFPILVEGYAGRMWTKQPAEFGYREYKAFNGRIVHG